MCFNLRWTLLSQTTALVTFSSWTTRRKKLSLVPQLTTLRLRPWHRSWCRGPRNRQLRPRTRTKTDKWWTSKCVLLTSYPFMSNRELTKETQRFRSSSSEAYWRVYQLPTQTNTRSSSSASSLFLLLWPNKDNSSNLLGPLHLERNFQAVALLMRPKCCSLRWADLLSSSTKSQRSKRHTPTVSSSWPPTTMSQVMQAAARPSPKPTKPWSASFWRDVCLQEPAWTNDSCRRSSRSAQLWPGACMIQFWSAFWAKVKRIPMEVATTIKESWQSSSINFWSESPKLTNKLRLCSLRTLSS